MKLHELLELTPFDAIAPHIVRIFPEQTSQLPHYKEAYDVLRHTSPAQTNEQIIVRWCRIDEEYGEEPYMITKVFAQILYNDGKISTSWSRRKTQTQS